MAEKAPRSRTRRPANGGLPDGKTPPRLSVYADPRKDEAVQLAEVITHWLAARNALAEQPEDATVHVVLGGDGTVVRRVRTCGDKPMLGIDFGQFGFLTLVPPNRWERRLQQVLDGKYSVREDATMEVVIEHGGREAQRLWAVQDVVFHAYVVPGNGQQMALLELYIDGKYLNPLPGDGLIIATSPGSSAYNLSAGGPVLTPGSGAFAVTPISPHTPMRTSFTIPETTRLTVVHNGRFPVNVCVDGQETYDSFEKGDVAHLHPDPRRFRLVTFRDTSFYDRFRQRFNYRIRPGYKLSELYHDHL